YYALAIATGSMEPKISRGDIVIVEKIEDRIAELEVGRVIAYNYNEVVVVHRINKIVEEDNERFFYTKGDANNHVDNYVIKEDMIIGTVDFAVPYAGFPTVWINQ
ncbi:MAG: signal peptidase I, partial [Firmicutes bacterium]|nr:signal peptidase I [Bacillota bacterium]